MFQKLREAWREADPKHMTEETRAKLIEDYSAIAERYQRLVDFEESRMKSARYGRLRRRVWAAVRLCLCRVNERAARADVARLRSCQRRTI